MEFLLPLLPTAAAAFYLLPHASLRAPMGNNHVWCGRKKMACNWSKQACHVNSLMGNDLVLCGKTRKTCNPLELPT